MEYTAPDSLINLKGVAYLTAYNSALDELHRIYEREHGKTATIQDLKREYPSIWALMQVACYESRQAFGGETNA